MSLFVLSCEKEEMPEFEHYKPKYSIEGTYEGELHIICKNFNNLDKTYANTWNITSFNGEKLAIETNDITASAIFSNDGQRYDYIPYSTYEKTCTTIVYKYSGEGEIVNDTIREKGDIIIYYGSNETPLYGTFTGFGVKVK